MKNNKYTLLDVEFVGSITNEDEATINHNAYILQDVLDRLEELEERVDRLTKPLDDLRFKMDCGNCKKSPWNVNDEGDCSSCLTGHSNEFEPKESDAEKKLKQIKELTDLYETTMEWGCNDYSKCLFANAIYACMHPEEEYFQHCIDEFKNHLIEK